MNSVVLMGRLTNDIEMRYSPSSGNAVGKFRLAVNGRDKNDTSFVNITVFGKQAENADAYIGKGCRAIVKGRIQTGSYEKDGRTVYTTDIIADNIEYIDFKERYTEREEPAVEAEMPEDNFQMINEQIPF